MAVGCSHPFSDLLLARSAGHSCAASSSLVQTACSRLSQWSNIIGGAHTEIVPLWRRLRFDEGVKICLLVTQCNGHDFRSKSEFGCRNGYRTCDRVYCYAFPHSCLSKNVPGDEPQCSPPTPKEGVFLKLESWSKRGERSLEGCALHHVQRAHNRCIVVDGHS